MACQKFRFFPFIRGKFAASNEMKTVLYPPDVFLVAAAYFLPEKRKCNLLKLSNDINFHFPKKPRVIKSFFIFSVINIL